MALDDVRLEWMRDKVYAGLDIEDTEIFEELLNREDGEYERKILKFLNESPESGTPTAILFYCQIQEEEEEVEVECEPEVPDIPVDDGAAGSDDDKRSGDGEAEGEGGGSRAEGEAGADPGATTPAAPPAG
ncbi:uncharacterized protein [Branchiostoma lanceolatum]|uniref:uncharacterized protein n=1 Tax=Branchiostoma lanceolatum TaxID=7740 RepID=UPI00345406EA